MILYMTVFYEFSETLRKKVGTNVELSTNLTSVRRSTEFPRGCACVMQGADLESNNHETRVEMY